MAQNELSRDKIIVRTSIIGILANLLLAAFKAAVGLLSHSIAVVLDAVNNLSDALSSVITIIGTKLASRRPDKDHPLGHGRYEYLSALLVAAIVLYAGITSLVESVKKIIRPEAADYSVTSLIIIASAIAVKLVLGRYVKSKGEEVNSDSLIASGEDARFDAILSASVLISAIIFLTTGISLEAIVGVVISGFIIKSGYEMLTDTLDDIIGKRTDNDLVRAIKATIAEDPDAHYGAFDLILHSYGPDRLIGSVHVAVPDTMTAQEIDTMTRRLTDAVYAKHGVILAGVGIYSLNTSNEEIREIQSRIAGIVMGHDGVLQMHGFYCDPEKKEISFDIVLDFALEDRDAVCAHIADEVQKAFPDYTIRVALDLDV